MSATMELPRLFTIGEVKRQLQADGLGRSETAIRRLEDRGVVKPFRAVGQDRRLYTEADVQAISTAIRDGYPPLDAA